MGGVSLQASVQQPHRRRRRWQDRLPHRSRLHWKRRQERGRSSSSSSSSSSVLRHLLRRRHRRHHRRRRLLLVSRSYRLSMAGRTTTRSSRTRFRWLRRSSRSLCGVATRTRLRTLPRTRRSGSTPMSGWPTERRVHAEHSERRPAGDHELRVELRCGDGRVAAGRRGRYADRCPTARRTTTAARRQGRPMDGSTTPTTARASSSGKQTHRRRVG